MSLNMIFLRPCEKFSKFKAHSKHLILLKNCQISSKLKYLDIEVIRKSHPLCRLSRILFTTIFLLWPKKSNEPVSHKNSFLKQSRVKIRPSQKETKHSDTKRDQRSSNGPLWPWNLTWISLASVSIIILNWVTLN